VRCLFDMLAYVHLLLKGRFKSAQAVVEAYQDFQKMRPAYKPIRRENLKKDDRETYRYTISEKYFAAFLSEWKKTYQAVYSK